MLRSFLLTVFVATVIVSNAFAAEIVGQASVGVNFALTRLSDARIRQISETVHQAFQNETEFDQGCEARARLISLYLDRQDIHNGLVYTEETLRPVVNPRHPNGMPLQWAYHVAVGLLGDDGELSVIDPFFDHNLFTALDWLKLTTSATRASFSDGELKTSHARATVDWVAPYYWSPPYQLSEQLISETTRFDPYETQKAKRLYPLAAQALGL
jgi:hypothetical protein